MSTIRIGVIDAAQTEKVNMEVPDDVNVAQLTEAIVEAMHLPITGLDGSANGYHLNRRDSNGILTRLDASRTLAQIGVQQDSVFQLTVRSSEGHRDDLTVFLSWSGERSKLVAQALKDWLPLINNRIKPWVSSEGIFAGARWIIELSQKLEQTDACILCLTKDNLLAPWLHFEAGAASKRLGRTLVCPFLLDVSKAALPGPLAQFQACEATGEETFKLVIALNEELGQDRPYEQMKTLFDVLWPKLEKELSTIRIAAAVPRVGQSDRELLEGLIQKVGSLSRNVDLIVQLATASNSSSTPKRRRKIVINNDEADSGPSGGADKPRPAADDSHRQRGQNPLADLTSTLNEDKDSVESREFLQRFVQRSGE